MLRGCALPRSRVEFSWLMWAIWRKVDEPSLPAGELVSAEEPRVRLRLGLRHLAAWGLLAGLMAVATTALSLTDFRNLRSLALFFLGGGGVPALGPWIGPAINPGGGFEEARSLTWVAAPILLIAATPVSFAAPSPSACGDGMVVRASHRPALLAGRRTIPGRLVHELRQRRQRALGAAARDGSR
jgi:MFS family permease